MLSAMAASSQHFQVVKMKKNFLINLVIAASFGMAAMPAIGQIIGAPLSTALPATSGESLFLEYSSKFVNKGAEGRMVLDAVYARGLKKTPENINKTRTLLASKISDEEKVGLIRILGSLYSPASTSTLNEAILSDLRKFSTSGNKEIGRTAVLTYSRLGYFPDSVNMLTSARNSGYIDNRNFCGELAHLLPYAPVDGQTQLIEKIKSEGDSFSAEILASYFQNKELIKRLSPQTRDAVLSYLEVNEPAFVQATGEFDFVDGIRYSAWLHAMATLSSMSKNANYADYVITRLDKERTDPRKMMGFLMSAEGQQLISQVARTHALDNVQEKMNLYVKQHPMNSTMQEVVRTINERIKAARA